MCIIFVKRGNQIMSSDWAAAMRAKGNYDGAGVMYVDTNGNVVVEKILRATENEVRELYEAHQHLNIAFHVRNKTKGDINYENVHPFYITRKEWGDPRDIAMMHNGTINEIQVDPSMCDSYNLAHYFLAPIFRKNPDWLDDEDNMNLLSALVGKSRLVFLDDRGKFSVVNSKEGYYLPVAGGVWCSRREKDIHPLAPLKSTIPSTTTTGGTTSSPVNPQVTNVVHLPPPNVLPPTQPGSPFTGSRTPDQLGMFVKGEDGLKCFRLRSGASANALMLSLQSHSEADKEEEDTDDGDALDLESLSLLSEEEILDVVKADPVEIARVLASLGSSYQEVRS